MTLGTCKPLIAVVQVTGSARSRPWRSGHWLEFIAVNAACDQHMRPRLTSPDLAQGKLHQEYSPFMDRALRRGNNYDNMIRETQKGNALASGKMG